MNITKRPFGSLADGTPVSCWRVENDAGLAAELLDFGATIRSVIVPDRNGSPVDVVLGYDDIESYVNNGGCFGGTIGRFANRIGGASFELNGKEYPLLANNGTNHIHGGKQGFHKRMWQAKEDGCGVRFDIFSPDGDEGYPGNLSLQVWIGWEGNGLALRYHAESDQDTILNLTNHVYFNLDGEGDVQEQLLRIDADSFTINDPYALPTGDIVAVEGTAMDFRTEKPIGRDAGLDEECIRHSHGYDSNLILNGTGETMRARSLKSGIVLTASTDQPGVQLYTANNMKERPGKGGKILGHRAGFCLETQHYPDCIHHPEWPSCILRRGEAFESRTVYAFSTDA